MSRQLLMLNALLVGASVGLVAYIGWQVASPKTEMPTRRAASGSVGSTAASPTTPDRSGGAYGTIASRNLFSPDRSEAPSSNTAANALAAVPKPSLHGVILRDGAPVAYLEDPITKRVAGYRVGDSVAGGTLQSISEDRVILMRPEGQVDVRLHDPSRPRPPVPAAAGQAETAAQRPPFPIPQPGVPQPFPGAATPPGFQPPVTSTQPDLQGQQPGRRPLPPNLLRRVPPGMPDAPNR
jgi:hypothetical protein